MNIYFIVWLFGTLVLLLPRVNFLRKHFVPILALLLLFAAMIVRPLVMTGRLFTESWTENLFVVDLFLAFAFGFFVYSLLHLVSDKIRGIELKRLGNISKQIAGFSFSLYLLHYPIINTFYYWAASNGFTGFQPGIASVLLEVLFVALICMIAFLFSRITEARTPLVRKFMKTTITAFTVSRRDKTLKKQNVTG